MSSNQKQSTEYADDSGYEQWCKANNRRLLTPTEYSDWKALVISADDAAIEQYLMGVTLKEAHKLVNCVFEFQKNTISWASRLPRAKFDIVTPLATAVARTSVSAMEVLIENGAKVTHQDRFGNNIVHLMVCCAFFKPELEVKWTQMYVKLIKMLSLETVQEMLHEENADGLRPI